MPEDDQLSPDPRKITIIGGVIFNPWVNIFSSLAITVGLGWMTAWFWSLWVEVTEAPAYEDQGLDAAGTLIGVVACALATLGLVTVTIWLIFWWAKRR